MTGEATLPWGAPWGRPSADIAVSEQIARDQIERDASLVEKCLHGDNGAWEELVRAHTRIVCTARATALPATPMTHAS